MTLNLQDRWLCHIVIIARLRGISWSKAAKSKDYHLCSNRVNVADIWRERAYTLRVEVSQWFYQSSNNEQCEVSRAHSSEEEKQILKKGIAAIAKRTAMVEVNTVCPLIAFQPEVPEELKKLRKF